jgi:hypothetical protein
MPASRTARRLPGRAGGYPAGGQHPRHPGRVSATVRPEWRDAARTNQFAANSGAGLRDLMTRMGYDSERAAMIYQHEARGADKAITDAIDKHVDEQKREDDENDEGQEEGVGA